MSRVTNMVLLFADWLDSEEANDILKKLTPLENQELNKGKCPCVAIDNYNVGVSRYLEKTVIVGTVHNIDETVFINIVSQLQKQYCFQVMISGENDEGWHLMEIK